MIDMVSDLLNRAAYDGGWTVDITDNSVPTRGYSVGGHPDIPEWILPGWNNLPGPFLFQEIGKYLAMINRAGGVYSGGWINDQGALVLDSPSIVPDLHTAEFLGRERGETAIYCLHTDDTITL